MYTNECILYVSTKIILEKKQKYEEMCVEYICCD